LADPNRFPPAGGARGIRGLYGITPDFADTAGLVSAVEQALTGGVRLIQYRNKVADDRLAKEQANALRSLTTRFDSLLIINDSVELALATKADGVHLGREDGEIGDIAAIHSRAYALQNGRRFWIGVSCYDDIGRASRAAAAGADYLAFGAFFPSRVKPGAVRAAPSLIGAAKDRFQLPVVAIGGITQQNASPLIEAGVDSIAVISALFGAPDIAGAAQHFNSLFDPHE
jgi:thiamine-phosphate pyrophosphorylase